LATCRISSEAAQRDEAAQAFHQMGRRDAVLEAAQREDPVHPIPVEPPVRIVSARRREILSSLIDQTFIV
jgi:uncharacterized protein (DUF3084 family)